MPDLEIKYKVRQGADREIDMAITEAMRDLGYKWYAQGFDLTTGVRDICYILKQKKVLK